MSTDCLTRRTANAFGVVAGLALTAIVGCGGTGLPLVQVNGKVTFDGGQCPAPGNVGFTPVEVAPGLPRRPGSGQFNQDGTFVVTSFKQGDGLIPGRYAVKVMCFSGLPDPRSKDPWGDVSYVPDSYKAPELVVQEGSGAIDVTYDVPLKKIKGGPASPL